MSEPLACNSLTTERIVSPTPYGVCNELAILPGTGKTKMCSSPRLPRSLSPLSQLGNSVGAFDEHLSSALYLFTPAPTFPFSLSLTHTPCCLFVAPTPLFSHSIIYSSLCPGKAHPHIGGKGKGAGSKHPRRKHFNSESKLSRGTEAQPSNGLSTKRGGPENYN